FLDKIESEMAVERARLANVGAQEKADKLKRDAEQPAHDPLNNIYHAAVNQIGEEHFIKLLLDADYEQDPRNPLKFRPHNSTSGSYATTIYTDGDGVLRVVTLNQSSTLINAKGRGHDFISAFPVLKYDGNDDAALRDVGDNYLMIGGETWNQRKQRLHTTVDVEKGFADAGVVKTDNHPPPANNELTPLERLMGMSTTENLHEMKKNLSNDVFVFLGMALTGQITLFYGKPNTGKTLFFLAFLISSIKLQLIKGVDVIYINADDHYKGLYTKTEIAKENGFSMISPADSGMSPAEIIKILDDLSQTDDAKGKIIILDTLKKFADMMNKRSLADLFVILRKLIAKNATVIIAGHANKNLDAEGKLVYEGTADTVNDIDCAYSMNLLENNDGQCKVQFVNEKARGDVVSNVTYTYSKNSGDTYDKILGSVKKLDDKNGPMSGEEVNTEVALRNKYMNEILFVINLLRDENLNTTNILDAFKYSDCDFSRRSLVDALDKLNGITWFISKPDKNTKLYSLNKFIPPPPPPPTQ
ncbi:MAG: ATP-binding protein, partial [Thiotrichaceae bacterium]|nr:ATP-binding protein [Thiotrichaceae bacterium]